MLMHQENQQPPVVFVETEFPCYLLGDRPADLAVIVAKAFPQVVEQQGKVKNVFPRDRAVSPAERTVVVGTTNGSLDRLQRVLVDRVLVHEVELNQAPGVVERRQKTLQQPDAVQVAKQAAKTQRVRQTPEKQAASLLGHRASGNGGPDSFQSIVIHGDPETSGQIEQQQKRLRLAKLGVTHSPVCPDPVRTDHESIGGAVSHETIDDRPEHGRAAHPLDKSSDNILQAGGLSIVVAHEPLDAEQRALPLESQPPGQTQLLFPSQHVLSHPGMEVKFIADSQQEIDGIRQRAGIFARDRAAVLKNLHVGRTIASRGHPTEHVSISEPARTFLDVGFQQIDCSRMVVAVFRGPLGDQTRGEPPNRTRADHPLEVCLQVSVQAVVPDHEPGLHECRPAGQVAAGERHAIGR